MQERRIPGVRALGARCRRAPRTRRGVAPRPDGMPGQPSRLAQSYACHKAYTSAFLMAHPSRWAMKSYSRSSTTDGWSRCGLCPHFWINDRRHRTRHLGLDRVDLRGVPYSSSTPCSTSTGHVTRGELGFDVPGAEGWAQPDVVPAPEHLVDVRVVRGQATPQLAVGQVAFAGWRRCSPPTRPRRRRAAPRGPGPRRDPASAPRPAAQSIRRRCDRAAPRDRCPPRRARAARPDRLRGA